MKVLYPKCAGLDVHKDTVVVAFRDATGKEVTHEVKEFGTTTPDLLSLHDWLEERGCTHAAMESTGVYWKPVWHLLEDTFKLTLGNAAHIKNVPGRKSDVKDSVWLSDLHAHGLIAASLIPTPEQAELRDLTRTRKQLARERGQHVQRVQKTLEDANIKLASVVSDIQGVTSRKILNAIVAGISDPKKLAALNDRKLLMASQEELERALTGHIKERHRFELGVRLRLMDALAKEIEVVEGRVGEKVASFRESVELLKTIPGWKDITVQAFVAEVGLDMSRFPDGEHLVSWCRICPRSDQTAGKRRNTRMMKGNKWLKPTLSQAAHAATRANDTYLQAQFFRIKARSGAKTAIGAVMASQLQSAYYMLKRGQTYKELGPDHFEKREKPKVVARLLNRLKQLGANVEIKPSGDLPAPAPG